MSHLSRLQSLVEFLADEDATTAVEYAVMLSLIIVVCLGSVTFLTASTEESFNTSAAAIAGAFGN